MKMRLIREDFTCYEVEFHYPSAKVHTWPSGACSLQFGNGHSLDFDKEGWYQGEGFEAGAITPLSDAELAELLKGNTVRSLKQRFEPISEGNPNA